MRGRARRSASRGTALLAAALLAAACTSVITPRNDGATDDREPLRVGMLRSFTDEHHPVFVDELRAQGWQVGRNLRLYPADPTDIAEDVDEARASLRAWQEDGELDLVVAFSTPHAELAAEQLPDTPTLIVVNDPFASGLVSDGREPEGLLTGLTFRTPADRTFDLASRTLGGIDRLGYLWPEDDIAVRGHRAAIVAVAEEMGVELIEVSYDGPDSIAAAAEQLAEAEVDAVWLANSNAVLRSLSELEQHLVDHRLPTIANTEHPTFAAVIVAPDGGELRRQLARQASRLLAGTPVSAVPVEDPRRFVVIINTTQVEALGLPEVDESILRQADLVR